MELQCEKHPLVTSTQSKFIKKIDCLPYLQEKLFINPQKVLPSTNQKCISEVKFIFLYMQQILDQ